MNELNKIKRLAEKEAYNFFQWFMKQEGSLEIITKYQKEVNNLK
jgi:hypothetical protein